MIADTVRSLARLLLPGLLLIAVTVAPSPTFAQTQQVVVLTSFPKELFDAYKAGFERAHAGWRMEVVPKPTSAAITHVRERAARPDVDVFWASAVDAFIFLKSNNMLERYTLPADLRRGIPDQVAGFPVNDADGFFHGFAVSGYGIMWNRTYLTRYRLPAPKEWEDLIRPEYLGHLVISAPSRSGTTHLTVETILQGYGWQRGWELLLRMGGSMGAITERSFGVPEAVIAGQYGIGIVIDFFGLSAIASGQPVDFVYPSVTSIVPANVAIIRNAPNPEGARRFINYLLSDDGQRLLFRPEIARLPVRTALYREAPRGMPNPFTMKAGVQFNADLSASRYQVTNRMFDQIITFRHAELRRAWEAIYRAERAVEAARAAGRDMTETERMLTQARASASYVHVSERMAAEVSGVMERDAAYRSAKEREWGEVARASYVRAAQLAAAAEEAARRR
ncbi:MAG: extracellular solute-binding protein [Armatimonadota bacterium]|nr:extracellular solute-binding protein [Armatimonadota bacterium]MDR7453381.1 extracellular solute-binding protein [Armatimonadota bacterium]MDR7457200.1 extracellular solute-binding protein [Armatimonadota bacterium]MDR7496059.1 extracellular solute-binding protein [Armatimonadota bacterium]MDR7512051.1 extracellular solute-binding protein [Armatimonadota bacterium]